MKIPDPIEITSDMRQLDLSEIRRRLARIKKRHPEHYATIAALFRVEGFRNFEVARMNYLPK